MTKQELTIQQTGGLILNAIRNLKELHQGDRRSLGPHARPVEKLHAALVNESLIGLLAEGLQKPTPVQPIDNQLSLALETAAA